MPVEVADSGPSGGTRPGIDIRQLFCQNRPMFAGFKVGPMSNDAGLCAGVEVPPSFADVALQSCPKGRRGAPSGAGSVDAVDLGALCGRSRCTRSPPSSRPMAHRWAYCMTAPPQDTARAARPGLPPHLSPRGEAQLGPPPFLLPSPLWGGGSTTQPAPRITGLRTPTRGEANPEGDPSSRKIEKSCPNRAT